MIELDQIYKERTQRHVRHIVILGIGNESVRVRRCRADGFIFIHGRVSWMKTANLLKRFELTHPADR